MNEIIDNSPPTLTKLSLKSIQLEIKLEYIGASNVRGRSLDDINLHNKADTFIPYFFPKLSELKLTRCVIQGKMLNLPTMNLLGFHYEKNSARIISAKYLNNTERLYYHVDPR